MVIAFGAAACSPGGGQRSEAALSDGPGVAANALVGTESNEAKTATESQVKPRPTTTAITAPPVTTPPTTAAPATTGATTLAPNSIYVEMSPARPRVGQQVQFTVTASMPGTCCSISLSAGDDGQLQNHQPVCTAGSGGVQRITFSHTYSKAGTWAVQARADGGWMCDDLHNLQATFVDGKWTGVYPTRATTAALPALVKSLAVTVE